MRGKGKHGMITRQHARAEGPKAISTGNSTNTQLEQLVLSPIQKERKKKFPTAIKKEPQEDITINEEEEVSTVIKQEPKEDITINEEEEVSTVIKQEPQEDITINEEEEVSTVIKQEPKVEETPTFIKQEEVSTAIKQEPEVVITEIETEPEQDVQYNIKTEPKSPLKEPSSILQTRVRYQPFADNIKQENNQAPSPTYQRSRKRKEGGASGVTSQQNQSSSPKRKRVLSSLESVLKIKGMFKDEAEKREVLSKLNMCYNNGRPMFTEDQKVGALHLRMRMKDVKFPDWDRIRMRSVPYSSQPECIILTEAEAAADAVGPSGSRDKLAALPFDPENYFSCNLCLTSFRTFPPWAEHVKHCKSLLIRDVNFLGNPLKANSVNWPPMPYKEENPYSCKDCRVSFYTVDQMTVHYRMHKNDYKYECDVCYNKYPTLPQLRYHRKVHEKEKQYRCGFCVLSFASKAKVLEHRKSHPLPVQCQECPKAFDLFNEFVRHSMYHNSTRHTCEECTFGFVNKLQYDIHKSEYH